MTSIQSIKIREFRNIIAADCFFNSGYNLLIGENGQGKTNLLEAIYYLSILRSFRTASIRELKSWKNESDVFYIGAEIADETSTRKLSVSYGKKRSVKINGSEISRASDYIGELICIIFSPEDIELVTGSGKIRRRFMDICLSQLNKKYLHALQSYSHILKNRNQLLKSNRENSSLKVIASFDEQLIKYGAYIHCERIKFIENLKELIESKSDKFYDSDKLFSLSYRSNTADKQCADIDEVAEQFKLNLKAKLERDLERGTSHCGPHRDDFTMILQSKRLNSYGSRGQCRLASLLLRLCSAELFLAGEHRDDIIFLVDDVTGELDEKVKNEFFKLLEKGSQIFFAATEVPEILKEKNKIKIFSVKEGELKERELVDNLAKE